MAKITVQGTTGSYSYEFQKFPGYDWQQFVLQYNNYSQDPAQSQPFIGGSTNIQFQNPFQAIPSIDVNTTGLNFVVTQNYLTVPVPPYVTVPVDQIINGVLILEGF